MADRRLVSLFIIIGGLLCSEGAFARCVWYGVCTEDYFCSNNSAARVITDADKFDSICNFHYSSLCCDTKQQETMESGLKDVKLGFDDEAAGLLKKAMCAITCSPRQSTFTNVTEVEATNGGVSAISVRIPKDVADKIYKGLSFLGSLFFGRPANASAFFKKFGKSKKNNGNSPFAIDFILDEQMEIDDLLRDEDPEVSPATDRKTDSATSPITDIKTDFETSSVTDMKADFATSPVTDIKTDSATSPVTDMKTDFKTSTVTDMKTDSATTLVTDMKTDIEISSVTVTETVTSTSSISRLNVKILVVVFAFFGRI